MWHINFAIERMPHKIRWGLLKKSLSKSFAIGFKGYETREDSHTLVIEKIIYESADIHLHSFFKLSYKFYNKFVTILDLQKCS